MTSDHAMMTPDDWNGPIIASDGTRTVEAWVQKGPDDGGYRLVDFDAPLIARDNSAWSFSYFDGTGRGLHPCDNITISPAAKADAPDELAALREESARLRECVNAARAALESAPQ